MKRNRFGRLKIAVIACFATAACLVSTSGAAFAHKVTVFAWVDGDMVHTVSKFSGGRKVNGGSVIVYDAAGERLLEGKTDDKGEFSFRSPVKADLRIELLAGMGHKNFWTIPAGDFEPGPEAPGAGAPEQETARKPTPHEKKPVHHDPGERPTEDMSREIQLAVEKALDKKLKPVIEMLADSREQKPSMREIIGGVGYIFGLVGVVAWFHSRRKKE